MLVASCWFVDWSIGQLVNWLLVAACWVLVAGCWLVLDRHSELAKNLFLVNWLLVACYWLLVAGWWVLVVSMLIGQLVNWLIGQLVNWVLVAGLLVAGSCLTVILSLRRICFWLLGNW
ncbi:MAG: hypothetical protein R6U46_08395 [Marinilabilia sp.]